MTTLTDRYVAEVARRLPERSREDISREIRATIADMIEAQPGPADEVERAAIVELGDPAVLARQYADQPQYLVGPEIYPAFIRLMTWVVPLVGLISIASSTLTYATTDDAPRIGEMIGTSVGELVVALVMTFGIGTIIAGLLERLLPDDDRQQLLRSVPYVEWTVDDLWRDLPTRRVTRGESIASLVLLAFMAAVPFIPASFFYVPDVPSGEGLLDPDLWSGWIPGFLVIMVLMAGVEVVKLVQGAVTATVLWAGVVVDLAMGVFLTVLLWTQDVVNPALPDATAIQDVPIVSIVLLLLWAGIIWDQVATIRAYRLTVD
jgi:hypothetical protein